MRLRTMLKKNVLCLYAALVVEVN